MSIAEFLGELPAFAHMSSRALERVASMFRERPFGKKEIVIERGTPGDAMYIVETGQVAIPVLDRKGRKKLVANLGPREIFGEMSLLTGRPRSADVIGKKPGVLLALHKDDFDRLVREHPAVSRFLTELLAKRILESAEPSETVIGKYKLIGELGRGNMAVVYRGLHTDLNRMVAVKMLSHELALDLQFKDHFRREAGLVASLDQENIVRVYDTEVAYNTFFIIMEYLPGTQLSELLRQNEKLPPERVRDMVLQLARALLHAHEHGIVHRDVKPGNVMMTRDGRVKLMDFGIAMDATPRQKTNEFTGTAFYASPEQMNGETLDGRADLYSLGIMAFELLTGSVPFPGTMFQVVKQQLDDPIPVEKLNEVGTPEDLLRFILRATEKNPDDRYPSMAEVIEDISTARGLAKNALVMTIFYDEGHEADAHRVVEQVRKQVEPRSGLRLGMGKISMS